MNKITFLIVVVILIRFNNICYLFRCTLLNPYIYAIRQTDEKKRLIMHD